MKKIKTFTSFKESLVDRYSNEIDYIVYVPFDSGPGSEVEKVYKFLISKGVVFPGDPSDNTVIYLHDLYVKYILVNVKLNQMTYNTSYHGTYEKEDLFNFLIENGDISDDMDVYIVNDFMDLKKFYIPLNINNYFDNRNIYESLIDKLEGPSRDELLKNNSKEDLLLISLKTNDEELFNIALDANPYIDDSEEYLFYAFKTKNEYFLFKLLNYGLNVNSMIMCDFCLTNNLELFKLAIENFIGDKKSLLNTAIYYKNIEYVKYLLNEYPYTDINYENGIVLKTAIQKESTEIVELLLDSGINITKTHLDYAKTKPHFYGTFLIEQEYKKIHENYKKFNESLLDKLEGPSKQDAINGLNDKFANDELNSDEYFEKMIENGFLNELDDFLYENEYEYDVLYYGLTIAMDYKNYDVIKYFLDLGIDKSDIKKFLNNEKDEKIKNLLDFYFDKRG